MRELGKGLDRYLNSIDAWSMAFGCMVGWGAFVMPGTTFLPVAGPAGTMIAMGLGLLVMLVVAYGIVFLMRRNQRTGGIYAYTKEAFGRDHAFLCSWFLCLSYLTIVFLNGTALFLVIRTLYGNDVQGGQHYTIAGNVIYVREVAVSVLALAVIGFLFLVAKPALQRLQTVLALVLLAGSVCTAVCCLPHALTHELIGSFGYQEVPRTYAVFSLIILAPWAFVGFEVISFDTAHFRFPVRRTKAVVFSAIAVAAMVYTSMVLISVAVVPDGYGSWAEYIAGLGDLQGVVSVPTFYAARAIMGTPGLIIMTMTALAAILTGIIGAYRATMRILSTMAEDRILSEHFSRTSYSILFIMFLSILISLLGRNTLNWFVDLTSFGAIVAYGYTSAAAFRIARTERNRRVMAAGLIGAGIAVLFGIVQVVPRLAAVDAMGSQAFLLLSLWCLLGFVFYWRTIKRSNLTEYSGMSTSGTVLFALLVYAAIMWLGKSLAGKASLDEVRTSLISGGILLILIIFVGLMVMLYIQNLVRIKHETAEREKIRAMESSLAKSQFLFNMSHDIRTPMNAILGYTNLALREEASDTLRDHLTKIEASGRHLLDLINDILEMSRIENGRLDLEYIPEDICLIFDEIRDLYAEQMRQKEMDFSVHTGQVQDRYVWCDKRSLNRVLLNLISNAYKFTPEKGMINVSLTETGSENGYGSYEIRVQDSGIGMSREFVEKMWGAFERERTSTDSGVEGTGLGLAITKGIVDMMGGTIEVLTSPGSGTQIIIRVKFQMADKAEVHTPEHRQADASENPVDFTGRRLLLVEDHDVNREIAEMILGQMGFIVETAGNGKIAVDMVTGSQPGYYDAILMDIQMPVMDGYAATRQIRSLENRALAEIPILAMTANAFQEDVDAALQAGMQAHIAKPIDIGVLTRSLQEALSSRE